jgi:hypothetical protein
MQRGSRDRVMREWEGWDYPARDKIWSIVGEADIDREEDA